MAGVVAGKSAIVTGAGRGIGRGIALRLAAEGARVVVCDVGASLQGAGLDAGPAQETVAAIKKAGGQAIASTLSIVEPKNAEQIVKSAIDAFGRVDILVNNAGILRDVIFHKMSWSDWSDVIAVHLNGSFNMSRAVAGHFREQNFGSFVHMTSTSGLVGNFGQANYMAAKMGIVGLSRGIALDMARFNVRSNCVAPFAFTRMIDSIPAETEAEKAQWKDCMDKNYILAFPLDLWVMDSDGSNKRMILHNGATNFAPSWHPDGKRIIFASNRDDWHADIGQFGHNFELYLISIDGTGLERITYNNVFDSFPMFSPDGKKLDWASNRNPQKPHETDIYIADWEE
jgi:NAD(P)-dependent dehydrogenase (short-subunit alcohol dehydrogenase family)